MFNKLTLGKVVSFLTALVAAGTALAPFLTQLGDKGTRYAVYTAFGCAVVASAASALSQAYGSVALTVVGVVVAACSAVGAFTGVGTLFPPNLLIGIAALGAVAASLGKSLFGWEPSPALKP